MLAWALPAQGVTRALFAWGTDDYFWSADVNPAVSPDTPAEVLTDTAVIQSGLDACSFFWSFYVANGLVLFVLLYLL